MRAWVLLLMLLPACGGCGDDADVDANGSPDAQQCFGSFVKVCFTKSIDVSTPMIPDATADIDTGSSPMCDQHNDQMAKYCVVAGTGFTLSAGNTIRAYGPKPLVLLSTSTMVLQGTIDVSSNRMPAPKDTGAGANPTACGNNNGTSPEMAGGGYGGSFGGKGGDGERFSGASATSGVAAQALTAHPVELRGGCPGGNGDNAGGLGGSGGGAVAFIAMMSIQLDGQIKASGTGGRGGPATKSGGGGGGSGGMIILDTSSVTGAGLVFANGGGGGQGGAGAGAGMGMGADGGESPGPTLNAPAGYNTSKDGGSGGTGSAGTSRLGGNNAVGGAVNNGGGGGGGGGAGFIGAREVTVKTMNIAPPQFAL